MSFIFSSLDRKLNEGQVQFDNRVSGLLPVLAGRVYFDLRNYIPYSGEFNVYIEWDEELLDKLHDRLPSGGYFVKATIKQAYALHELKTGLPVYMKLVSRECRIYPYRTYTIVNGRPYSIEFNGGVLIPFEERYEELGCIAAGKADNEYRGSQKNYPEGSQKSYLAGSQYNLLTGSQKNYLAGSQYSLLTGSQKEFMYESEYEYRIGSRYLSLLGSQRNYLTGSQKNYLTGSQRNYLMGSQRQDDVAGMQLHIMDNRPQEGRTAQQIVMDYYSFLPQEWQLINRSRRPVERKGGNARLGYGLDLI